MPDEEMKSPTKIKFIYKKSEDYKQHFVNGAFGGFTPHGELVCDFFFEYGELPTEQESTVEGNHVEPIKQESPEVPEFIREIRSGIVMTPQQVISLKEWLERKIKEFQNIFPVVVEPCDKK